ncbi:MAG: 3-hydroxyacyl-CoA dehydrogenase [Bacteroidetes Order II. Incertae sedis bacterium]|nr:3-hydroxyacyl-CoA dehydrogenase [Bacteroidetes Order II. bacterium]
MQIQGNTFLVTGGSSGLGAGTAERLVELGANVIIADVNVEAGNAKAEALGDRAVFVQTDVTSETSVQAAIDTAVNTFGGLHGAISCAGILVAKKTVGRGGAHDLESFSRVINVNLIGTFNVIRLSAVAMSKNAPSEEGECGVLINTASVAAYDGQIGQAAYSASKGGVVGMTLPIARDLSRNGVRCMTIAPGIFETPMVAGMPDEVQESLISQIPFPKRLGKPSDYAFLAQHIIENVKLNGEVIRLDGGVRMGPR